MSCGSSLYGCITAVRLCATHRVRRRKQSCTTVTCPAERGETLKPVINQNPTPSTTFSDQLREKSSFTHCRFISSCVTTEFARSCVRTPGGSGARRRPHVECVIAAPVSGGSRARARAHCGPRIRVRGRSMITENISTFNCEGFLYFFNHW